MAHVTVDAGVNPAVLGHYYEAPATNSDSDEIWCYSDRPCYSPGDSIAFHVSTSAQLYSLEIALDAAELEVVFRRDNLPGKRQVTPTDASVSGCNWPVSFEFSIPEDWRSGGYRVTCRIDTRAGVVEQHYLFLLRSNAPGRERRLLLVSSTGT